MEITLKSIRTIFTRSKKTNRSDTTTASTDGKTSTARNSLSSDHGIATRIQNTPFVLVGNATRGYWIGYGNAQITPPFKTKKQALKHLEYHHWEVICNMITFTVEHWQKLKAQALGADKATEQIATIVQNNKPDHPGLFH